MGRPKSAPVVKTVSVGQVRVAVQQFADGRYGFDDKHPSRPRAKIRTKTREAAAARALEYARALAAGRRELLELTPRDLADFRKWKATMSGHRKQQLPEIVAEFMATKRADVELNPGYVQNLGYVLDSFVAAMPPLIGAVTPALIDEHLTGLGKSPINRNNIRAGIVSLFRFAREREYLPDRTTAAEKVKKLKVRRDERDIEILSAGELQAILAAARPEYVPWLALSAFSGVRTEEVSPKKSAKSPLRWEDFRWSENTIAIRGATAKTGHARNVPIHPTLALWLAPWHRAKGHVLPLPLKYQLEIARLKTSGFTWKKNALRHTALSCRLAIVKNAAQVAEESGTSVKLIRSTYHNPRTIREARAWYAVRPETKKNVISFAA